MKIHHVSSEAGLLFKLRVLRITLVSIRLTYSSFSLPEWSELRSQLLAQLSVCVCLCVCVCVLDVNVTSFGKCHH